MTQKTKELLHPLLHVPAVADVVSDWMKNGRFIGLELQFPDGHRCKMTFAEIGKAVTWAGDPMSEFKTEEAVL